MHRESLYFVCCYGFGNIYTKYFFGLLGGASPWSLDTCATSGCRAVFKAIKISGEKWLSLSPEIFIFSGHIVDSLAADFKSPAREFYMILFLYKMHALSLGLSALITVSVSTGPPSAAVPCELLLRLFGRSFPFCRRR